jgi:hypothetical protein
MDSAAAVHAPLARGGFGTCDRMKTPYVPIALLVASVAAILPLAGTPFVSLSFFGFMLSLGGLGWWVISKDMSMDPRQRLKRAAEAFEENWSTFEQDFWAHVASLDASRRD